MPRFWFFNDKNKKQKSLLDEPLLEQQQDISSSDSICDFFNRCWKNVKRAWMLLEPVNRLVTWKL
jgi:hypothetical protein